MLPPDQPKQQIRAQIRHLLQQYFAMLETPFEPNKDRITLSTPTYGADDVAEALDSLLTGWPTIGPKVRRLEDKLADLLGIKHAVMLNSGGSANFLALYLLTSPYANPDRRLKPGDEVIVPAVGWSTTLAPIIQVGCVPVLVDVHLGTYDIAAEQIEANITPNTKALMIVHPLGHACEMTDILALCDKYNLILIEDTCESLGTKYDDKYAGTFGDFGTYSFYFSHHVTSVEGGMIVTNDDSYADALRSIRANGWLREIRDDRLRQRILHANPHLESAFLFPFIGFNFKPTDVAAGLALGQIDRLEDLLRARTAAAASVTRALQPHSDLLHLPYHRPRCRPGWFSYPVVVKDTAPFTKAALTDHLTSRRIDTRPIIAGNLAAQPFVKDFKVRLGDLPNAERIMRNGFFFGIHHKMDTAQLAHLTDSLHDFLTHTPPTPPS